MLKKAGFKNKPVLDRFHDGSRVVLLICLNLHSVLKAEKACESMRKCAKSCHENSFLESTVCMYIVCNKMGVRKYAKNVASFLKGPYLQCLFYL